MSFYRSQLEKYLSGLTVIADKVLDIGGAQGEVTKRVARWQVKEYKVMDLPDYNLEEYLWLEHESEQADVIFCLEVFEYIIDPVTAIRNIEYMLKKGGRAYITFAFVYPHHNELEMDALRYTEIGVRRLITRAGLSVDAIHYRVDGSGLLEAMYRADGMKMAKQYGHHSATGFIVELSK